MAGYAMLAEVVKALNVASAFFETDLEKLKAAVSMGYARGKLFEVANETDVPHWSLHVRYRGQSRCPGARRRPISEVSAPPNIFSLCWL